MIKKITVYWRDIPAQVIVQRGRKRGKAQLGERFQEAIDRAAMRAGKGSSDAYLEEWRRVTESLDESGEPEAIAKAAAQRLESQFDDDALNTLIKSHGVAE